MTMFSMTIIERTSQAVIHPVNVIAGINEMFFLQLIIVSRGRNLRSTR
jgi:hypothetical protein